MPNYPNKRNLIILTTTFILGVLLLEQFIIFPLINEAYFILHLSQIMSNFIFKTAELLLFISLNYFLTKQKVFLMPSKSWLTVFLFIFISIVCIPFFSTPHLENAILTGLMGGIPEEYFSRGVLLSFFLTYFVRNNYSRTALIKAIFISNFIFALMHLTNLSHESVPYVILQCILSFVSGLSYSAIYVQTGSLYLSMFMHFTKDFILTADVSSQLTNILHSSFAMFQLLLVVITFIYWNKHEPRLIRLIRYSSNEKKIPS
jgi:membrane protease YdiL (CAAX protease family)